MSEALFRVAQQKKTINTIIIIIIIIINPLGPNSDTSLSFYFCRIFI